MDGDYFDLGQQWKIQMTNAANADKYCSRMKIDHKQIVTDRHPRWHFLRKDNCVARFLQNAKRTNDAKRLVFANDNDDREQRKTDERFEWDADHDWKSLKFETPKCFFNRSIINNTAATKKRWQIKLMATLLLVA